LATKSITGPLISSWGGDRWKSIVEGTEWNISTHEYAHYELEFDLNNPHVLIEKEIWKLMVLEIFEDVEEENSCLGIVVPWILFSKVNKSLVTFQNFIEQ
jgi:hypothetical protein